ncbi:hypothetical protein ACFS7Z_23275 [Pontibacter toksunensis]|uniref:DUF7149 domain-containing protein n=1 Tax=Pontibacter toksunensis TaxID=1332631 RepID=A0ABW6C5Q7_9BACT
MAGKAYARTATVKFYQLSLFHQNTGAETGRVVLAESRRRAGEAARGFGRKRGTGQQITNCIFIDSETTPGPMQHHILRPRQALNKVYLGLKTSRADLEQFKRGLRTLLDSLNLLESEEHARYHLRDFLQSVFYVKYGINTKGKTDLVIHTGHTTKTNAGVLLEVKRPTNKADMPTPGNLNAKAVHELLLYYMQERVQDKDHDLCHLIVTSVHEWFVFDALKFERLFYHNTQLRKAYTDWQEGRKASTSTDFFYKEIAAPFISQLPEQITFTHFCLQDYKKPLLNGSTEGEAELELLYKFLSPRHLLKEDSQDEETRENSSKVCYAHLKGLREGFE